MSIQHSITTFSFQRERWPLADPRNLPGQVRLAAALLLSSLAVASAHATWGTPAAEAPAGAALAALEARAPLEPAAADPEAARQKARCAGCGFVQSIRFVEPVAGAAGTYEFTVRMTDGTFRVSQSADAGRWRAGDRILLIGGPRVAGS